MSDIDPNQIKIIDNLLSHGIHQPTEKNQLRMSNKSIIADGITVIAFASDHLTSAKHLLRVVAGFFPSLLTDLFDAYRIKASLNNLKLDIYTVLCWLVALNTHTASTYLNVKRFFFHVEVFVRLTEVLRNVVAYLVRCGAVLLVA